MRTQSLPQVPIVVAAGDGGFQSYAQTLDNQVAELRSNIRFVRASSGPSLAEQFATLTQQWEDETGHLSSIEAMVLNKAYQRVIGMGLAAVPLLLREMELRPHHWHWALCAITGEDPVAYEHHGRVDLTARDWVDWGRAQGYVW